MTDRPAPMQVSAVIAVTDLDRARAFYESVLGFDGAPTPGGWLVAADHGTVLNLLPGIDDAGSASWPVATFRVDDVHATVRALRARGVAFLGSDELAFELDEDGVSTEQDGLQVAWLRDPDGNVLTVFRSST